MNSNLLAQLIEEWSAYSALQQRGRGLADFAAWLLDKHEAPTRLEETEEVKFKLIELSRIVEIEAKRILASEGMDFSAFRVLTIVEKLEKTKKLDVVISSLLETSTGFYVIKLLVSKKFLKEQADPDDKRSKLISLTQAGKIFLEARRKDLQKVFILQGLSTAAEKKTFVKMLNTLHITHKNRLQHNPQ